MDSSRRPYLIAALVIVAAMVVAMFVVGVPGCGGADNSSGDVPIRTTSSSDVPEVPQDANPGEGGIDVEEEEYGDTGPQDAGPLQMTPVSNTGAVIIYDLPEIRQIAYNTKTKNVSGVVSLTPASKAPSVTESLQYMSARNPLARFTRTTKKGVQVSGVPGYEVIQEVGPPMSSYGVSTIAKIKDQVLSISVSGPVRKKETITALHRKLVKAVRVGDMSAADKAAASQDVGASGSDPGTTTPGGTASGGTATPGTTTSGTTTSGTTTSGAGGGGGSSSGGAPSGGDIPIPRAPTKTTPAPAKKDPSRPVAGR